MKNRILGRIRLNKSQTGPRFNALFIAVFSVICLTPIGGPVFSDEGAIDNHAPEAELIMLVTEGEKIRNTGNLLAAQQKFDLAMQIAEQYPGLPPFAQAAVKAASGYNLFLLNKTEMAEQQLTDAYLKTVDGNPYLHALAGEYLGYLFLSAGESEQAAIFFEEALRNAKSADNEAMACSLEILRNGLSTDSIVSKTGQLQAIADKIARLPNGFIKSKLQLTVSQNLLDLQVNAGGFDQFADLDGKVFKMLSDVLAMAESEGQERLKAETLFSLVRLYRLQGKNEEALVLIDQAIPLINQANAKELQAQLEGQKGDLLRLQGENESALNAYEHAVNILFDIRSDMPIALPDGRSTINVLTDPIYRHYADLQLRLAEGKDQESSRQAIFKVVDKMEVIKNADIDDFFLGKCFIDSTGPIDWKTYPLPNAAIVYPILLEDRLELVVKTDRGISFRTIEVDGKEVKNQAQILAKALQAGRPFRPAARQLYNWLLRPIKDELERQQIKTLLYVPDRDLRSIPLAALYDGKAFVIEEFNVVTKPRLTFNKHEEPQRKSENSRQLLAGLSFANGPSIDKLPKKILAHYANLGGMLKLFQKDSQRELAVENLSLPSVESEITMLAANKNNKILLNSEFTKSSFKSSLESGDFDKVHIASHGFFGNNASNSFILAYDEIISLEDFRDSLNSHQLKHKPIDLLILSACDTAQGDDSMLLGFSGMAISNNVLSALGSLWSIDDEGALAFMRLLYDGLNRSIGKAEALREAQLAMLKSAKYKHPYYWSPYILMGDW